MDGAGTDLVGGGHAGGSWKAGTRLSPLVLELKACRDTENSTLRRINTVPAAKGKHLSRAKYRIANSNIPAKAGNPGPG